MAQETTPALPAPATEGSLYRHDPALDVAVSPVKLRSAVPLESAPAPERPMIVSDCDWLASARGAAAVVGLTGSVGLLTYGAMSIKPESRGLESVPLADIGDKFQTAAELAGPGVLAAAAVGVAAFVATTSGRRLWPLAWRGLAPERMCDTPHDSLVGRARHRTLHNPTLRRAVAGIAVPAAGITALSTAFMIQTEVAEGPNRMVESQVAAVQEAAPTGKTITFNWEVGTEHYMEGSHIAAADVTNTLAALQAARVPGVQTIIPFKADLTDIRTKDNPNQASLIISVVPDNANGTSAIAPEVRPGAICETVNDRCALRPHELVVDAGEGLEIGDTTEVRGETATVVGFAEESQSLMGRPVMFKGLTERDLRSGYSGFVTVADSHEAAEDMLVQLGLDENIHAQTPGELLERNKDFWNRNGTPLIMLLVANTAMFATVTFTALRRGERERTRSQMAAMRSLGTSRAQIAGLQFSRLALEAGRSVIPAAAIAKGLELGIGAMMTGFHGTVTPATIAASTGMVVAIQTAAGLRWPRNNDLSGEMRDK